MLSSGKGVGGVARTRIAEARGEKRIDKQTADGGNMRSSGERVGGVTRIRIAGGVIGEKGIGKDC